MDTKPTYEELEKTIKELERRQDKRREKKASYGQGLFQRKQAEEALKESEKEYRSTLNDLLVGVVVHASDTSILLSNPEATAILGLTNEQMSGKKTIDPTWHFVHEDSTIMKVEDYPVSKVFSTKKPLYDYVVGINRPDRDYVTWVIVNAIPVFSNNGELEKVVVNFVDITTRKQAEEALRESEEKYQTILASIEDSYFEVNQRGEITFFNESFSKIIGYPPDELMGMKNDKYLDQKSRRKVFKMFNAVWKTGIPIKLFEYELIRKNGEKRTVQTSVSLMTDENGQKVGFRGIIRDVSYNKLMEEALRESEEKYRLLIENANDSIFIAQDESIKFPNPKGVEMTGYSAEELAKMPFINLIHPDDRDMVLDRHKRKLSGEKLPATYNFKMVNKAREEFWVQLNTVIINWEGRPATLNFLRDITEQKELEAQLQQTHKMEAIATLAGGIAHEFNNALTGVVGNIELLEMRLPDNKIVKEHTEAMKSSSHRMANLTSQLLAYARGGRYQAKTISLSDFVENTLPIIKSNIDPSIRLETDLPRDIFSVEADPAQIQMVLSAVVSNSSEAIEGEGHIRITASNKEIDAAFAENHPELNPGSYACLTVEDDGKGMDVETLNKIFDPFYTTKFMGRGLGMAAVYGIVRNHDGWITVDSELNKGTIIRIYLPAIETEEVKKEAIVESATEMPKGEGTILIIEDEEMVMNVIRAVLERLGYRMLEAETGREAVEIAKTFDGDIDLALLDIKLPDIRGDKVYPLIMEARPNLKVIVCSGYSIDTARGILDAGAQAFIQKPFSVKEISQKLREILDKG
ncbi:MAG TPA: PAS domain S-box protein [Desulfobacterales bacterium]|nr:PAS domain S-box protein [Desulfobacterales bacterium]